MIFRVFRVRTVAAFGAGAAAAYFLDPRQGYDRRERAIGRITRFAEVTEDVVEQVAEATGAEEPGGDLVGQSPPGPLGGSSLS